MNLSLRTLLMLGAIFMLALALRGLWIARTDTQLPMLGDPEYYHATAQNIAEGRGYSVECCDQGFKAGDDSEATAFWSPGFPMALAPFYKLFGSDIHVGKLFNAVAGALTVIPIFLLARRLTDSASRSEVVGLFAAFLFAVMPSLVFWTSALLSEPLCGLGIASTLVIAMWAGERGSIVGFVITGIMLAATAFVRSQAILIGVPVVILLLADLNLKSLVRVGIALGVGVAILIVPWAARNEAAMGRPYLINDNLAYNLRIAHAPNSTGTSVPPQDLWDERPGISFKERELFFDEAGGKRALAYARAHPKRELELAVYRVGYLVRSDSADAIWESLRVRPNGGRASLYLLLGDLFYYPLVALAALSVLLLKPSRLCVALWSSILVWIGLHLVFAGEPRYHVPLMPVAAVLAAGAVGSFISRISARMLD